jgi:hypothetical protein
VVSVGGMGDEPLARRADGGDEPLEETRKEAVTGSGASMVRDVAIYALARLVLVAALAALIYGVARLAGVDDFPLYIALAFAIVIALPLGIWVFAPLRRRATAGIGAFDERRRRDKEQLRARLRGEKPPE